MLNSYEQFRAELIEELIGSTSTETISKVLSVVDGLATKYDISHKEMSVAEYNVNQTPELVKRYCACKIVSGMSKNTLEMYELVLSNMVNSIRKMPADITPNDIRVYLFKYQQENGISNRSLDRYRTIISAFFSWAKEEGYIPINPCNNVEKIKYEQKQRESLTTEELDAIRSADMPIRDKAIIEFLYSTGARVSELVNVKIADIDTTHRQVELFGKGMKYRTSYLNDSCLNALAEYLSSRSDNSPYLFVSLRNKEYAPLSTDSIEKMIGKVSENTIGKRISPHILRHTTATMGLKNGMQIEEIQTLLGHSNISTTMIYAQVDDTKVRASHMISIT